MIKFIDLTNQIYEGKKYFAFYDTTTDRFIEFCGGQIFSSVKEWGECFSFEVDKMKPDRFLNIIPDEWCKK